MTMTATSVASEVSTVDEAVMAALPFVSTILGLIPGAQVGVPIVVGVGALLKAVDMAAQVVAASNPTASGSDVVSAVITHLNNIVPPTATTANGPPTSETQDPSAQGSG